MKNNIFLFLIFFLSLSLFALEIVVDDYKLEVFEEKGSFLFSVIKDGTEISLFSSANPGTTGFYIYENERFYSLESSRHFEETFTESENGAVISWQSDKINVLQEYTLLAGGELFVKTFISNISNSPVKVGYKVIIDTSYEEENRFVASINNEKMVINSEFENTNSNPVDFWTSGSLYFEPQIPVADRIIFGNWDRLNKGTYDYETVLGRNFDNPPYSINDGAVLQLYNPQILEAGSSVKYSFLLRAVSLIEDNVNNIVDSVDDSEAESPFDDTEEQTEPVATEDNEDETADESISPPVEEQWDVDESLKKVEDIKNLIELLKNPGMITDNNLKHLETLITELELLKKNNEDRE